MNLMNCMNRMNRMKICFIGASGHSSAVVRSEKLKGLEVAGVAAGSAGENIDGLHGWLHDLGHAPEKYADYVQMLDDVKPEIAVVDNFYGDHAKASVAALERGAHVFADKPLATTPEDLGALKEAHAESGRKIAAMFTMRFEAAYRAAHDLVSGGAIGDVRLLNAQKSYKLGARPDFYRSRETFGGLIPWVGIHALELIYLFTGGKPFKHIDAGCSRVGNANHGDLDVTAAVNLISEGGIISTVSADYLRPSSAASHGDDRLRIVGTAGTVEVLKGKVTLIDAGGEREIPLPLALANGADGADIFADFLDYIGDTGGANSAEDAFYITEAALKAQISADSKS